MEQGSVALIKRQTWGTFLELQRDILTFFSILICNYYFRYTHVYVIDKIALFFVNGFIFYLQIDLYEKFLLSSEIIIKKI